MIDLKIIKEFSVDFYDKAYISINAKRLDKSSRSFLVSCADQGTFVSLNKIYHAAFIRYRKANSLGVFYPCTITNEGKILVELIEQMLDEPGNCYADLMLVQRGKSIIDEATGELLSVENSAILSTMVFCINVLDTSIDNCEIEVTYEYDKLNQLMETILADHRDVITIANKHALLSKSYAVGDTGIADRDDENVDNAKYYYNQTLSLEQNVSDMKDSVEQSKEQVFASEMKSAQSELNAAESATLASEKANSALQSSLDAAKSNDEANQSAIDANNSAISAENSKNAAEDSSQAALNSQNAAKISEENAKNSEELANDYVLDSMSYAVGGSGTRPDEDSDNARYYYEMVKTILEGLSSGFIPMGTITFAQLSTVEKITGYTYNISDDFITDASFNEGPGKQYSAGTNVYCTKDGFWDCLGGALQPIATVDEMKQYLEI